MSKVDGQIAVGVFRRIGDGFSSDGKAATRIRAHRSERAAKKLKQMSNNPTGSGDMCCLDCGRGIPAARLKINPYAIRCVNCQVVHERQTIA